MASYISGQQETPVNTLTRRSAALACIALLVACGGDKRSGATTTTAGTGGRGLHGDTLTIAMIGKAANNPVFTAARNGAEAAARDLSQKFTMHIAVRWLTPDNDDAAAQAYSIGKVVSEGADAILIAPVDTAKVTEAIDSAVAQGVQVMTFDSDAPASKRFSHYGVDDFDLGKQVVAELATMMGNKGSIAILAGNPAAPNLQARVRGATAEAASHPGMKVVGTFNHAETPEAATAEVTKQNRAHSDIAGWAMVGGWPLFGTSFNLDPRRYKVVAVDALPSELDYVDKGVVPVLLAQPVYQWGYTGVETIVDKVKNKAVVQVFIPMKPVRVTKENLKQWAQQLKDWGFTDVPGKYLQ
jgi:ribose transport system substrate-binding protein